MDPVYQGLALPNRVADSLALTSTLDRSYRNGQDSTLAVLLDCVRVTNFLMHT